jgi:hypothetical protein
MRPPQAAASQLPGAVAGITASDLDDLFAFTSPQAAKAASGGSRAAPPVPTAAAGGSSSSSRPLGAIKTPSAAGAPPCRAGQALPHPLQQAPPGCHSPLPDAPPVPGLAQLTRSARLPACLPQAGLQQRSWPRRRCRRQPKPAVAAPAAAPPRRSSRWPSGTWSRAAGSRQRRALLQPWRRRRATLRRCRRRRSITRWCCCWRRRAREAEEGRRAGTGGPPPAPPPPLMCAVLTGRKRRLQLHLPPHSLGRVFRPLTCALSGAVLPAPRCSGAACGSA